MKVSVITINRNNKDGLEATIKSVVSQLPAAIEFIIIDGNSTDGSKDIIKKYEEKISYWVSEADNGIYHAMNKGIRIATGEYLLFLNSGDRLYDNTVIQEFYRGHYTEDIVFGDIIYEGDPMPFEMPDRITLSTFTGASIGHGAAFIKAELFRKWGLYNEENKIVSDWEFFLKAFIRYECSYKHVGKIFTIYQKDGVSRNPQYNAVQAEERNNAFKSILPLYYDLIVENAELKYKLAGYEQSAIMQLLKKLQRSGLNRLKNKYIHSKGK